MGNLNRRQALAIAERNDLAAQVAELQAALAAEKRVRIALQQEVDRLNIVLSRVRLTGVTEIARGAPDSLAIQINQRVESRRAALAAERDEARRKRAAEREATRRAPPITYDIAWQVEDAVDAERPTS